MCYSFSSCSLCWRRHNGDNFSDNLKYYLLLTYYQINGRPWPFLFFFPLVAAVGFGLLFTTDANTDLPKLIGFQILVGMGLGAVIENTVRLLLVDALSEFQRTNMLLQLVVAQAEYADNEALVPQVTSLITFMQLLGSSIALACVVSTSVSIFFD